MKKINGLIVLCFFICLGAFAQPSKSTITGIVKDSNGLKPLQYVTVELFKPGNFNLPVKSAYTNDKGKFTLSSIDTGKYTLIISHTGFLEKQQNIAIANAKQVDISDVILSTSVGVIKGVTINARKPLIEQTDDKIIFNVENDPATKTETAIDILRKTPFVSVDGDNNITVNGQSNFKVLLNGRETAMFAQNVKEALKGFPGALITKIEVITTPSAKYDAEE